MNDIHVFVWHVVSFLLATLGLQSIAMSGSQAALLPEKGFGRWLLGVAELAAAYLIWGMQW